jgi:CheY-like chemotaxis protein
LQHDKPRVLIVDDHPANRLAFQVVLEKDYDVHVVESGRQAIELAQREEFAVILLDVRMPVMDGFETATKLRRLGRTTYTSIIFTSAIDKTQEHINQGFDVGATDYLFTPVDTEFLKFKVATYAQIFVRNQALRLQIAYLNEVVRALRAEAKTFAGADTRIRQLEEVIQELKRQTQTPFVAS